MASDTRRRVRYVSGGFLLNTRLRRILSLLGYDLVFGIPRNGEAMLAWGHGRPAQRAEKVASYRSAPLIRVEDAFLRSLRPGRVGEPTHGLLIDHRGAYFDSRLPSDLEVLLATEPFDDGALIDRAKAAINTLQTEHLTKYAAVETTLTPPAPGYVLVIDQTKGDAAVTFGGASERTFREMLVVAQEEHPSAPILIKSHPETTGGFRYGYYSMHDAKTGRIELERRPISPWQLLQGAVAVYTVSSQLGFEAIFAGHKPVVFGQPFYAGWGLTDDRNPIDRRQRTLTRTQLFAGTMLLYPKWYDPYWDRLCPVEEVMAGLAARARAWREDADGYIASGMRQWKRPQLEKMLGQRQKLIFEDLPENPDRPVIVWANKETNALQEAVKPLDQPLIRVEDGFIRSQGLGAALTPPLSLVFDRSGIYYDPTRPSDLERLIEKSVHLNSVQEQRAARLIERIVAGQLSKYNLKPQDNPHLPDDRDIILIPGQVADDASVRLGCDEVADNATLLHKTRQANPDAYLIYKPHPDVAAGLREGEIDAGAADLILPDGDTTALFPQIDQVWTMTSLLGFEALLRGMPVTTLGTPFYAGWGLTRDLGRIPDRRNRRISLPQLVHAVLIDYPRYIDPVTEMPCPVEVVVERLIEGDLPKPKVTNRALSKLQSLFSSMPWLWR